MSILKIPSIAIGKDGINLNHAFVIAGYTGEVDNAGAENGNDASKKLTPEKLVLDFIKDNFKMEKGHPDLFVFSMKDFGIDQVDMIISANIRKPAMGHKKFIVSSFNTISHQAQNSLLKTLEEPRPDTHIFLVTPSISTLLPTVLSRVQVVDIGSDDFYQGNARTAGGAPNKDSKIKTDADKFLTSEIPTRLEIIKKMLTDKENEKIDDSDINNFVRELEMHAYRLENESKNVSKNVSKKSLKDDNTNNTHKNNTHKSLKPFLKVDEYIRDGSSSKKLLLEYLALRLPVY